MGQQKKKDGRKNFENGTILAKTLAQLKRLSSKDLAQHPKKKQPTVHRPSQQMA